MDNIVKNLILTPFNWLYKVNPSVELKIMFRLQQGYWMNMDNPKTYNEKLQWIKLHDKNPLMPICCDKYTVRQFVKDQGCEHILNPLLWEGFNPENIPFRELPNKFVIKVTHGSTFNIICTDKRKLDEKETIKKCHKWLKAQFVACYGEWFYGVERPRIVIEKYIESDDGEQLKDYKVFCFHGEPKFIRVDSDRFTDHKMDVFTPAWERIKGAHMGYHCSNCEIKQPECLNELLDITRKLSAPFRHARVDCYIVNGKVIFGEITFTNGAGYDRFEPREFDKRMGDYLRLD